VRARAIDDLTRCVESEPQASIVVLESQSSTTDILRSARFMDAREPTGTRLIKYALGVKAQFLCDYGSINAHAGITKLDVTHFNTPDFARSSRLSVSSGRE
jgi:hypothetical protein